MRKLQKKLGLHQYAFHNTLKQNAPLYLPLRRLNITKNVISQNQLLSYKVYVN